MHFLALLVELAAVVTPVIGIIIELRRDIPDDRDGGSVHQPMVPFWTAFSPMHSRAA